MSTSRTATRPDGDGANPLTIRTRLSDVRVFLRFAVSIEAVGETIPEKIVLPTVDREDRYREEIIDAEWAETIYENLSEYRFGTKYHVAFGLAWKIGCRLGAIHSLDVGDVDIENQRLSFVHRPDDGTTLKNGTAGERVVAIGDELASAIETYCEMNRLLATDDHGRDPLLCGPGSTSRNFPATTRMSVPTGRTFPTVSGASATTGTSVHRRRCPTTFGGGLSLDS